MDGFGVITLATGLKYEVGYDTICYGNVSEPKCK